MKWGLSLFKIFPFWVMGILLSSGVCQAQECSSYFHSSSQWVQIIYSSQVSVESLFLSLEALGVQEFSKQNNNPILTTRVSEDQIQNIRKLSGVFAVVPTEIRDGPSSPRESDLNPGASQGEILSKESQNDKGSLRWGQMAQRYFEDLEFLRTQSLTRKQIEELVQEAVFDILKTQNLVEFTDKDFSFFMVLFLEEGFSARESLERALLPH